MLNIGILSGASIVPRFVAGVKESGCAQVTAIATRDLSKAEKLAAELDIPQAYGDYSQLVSSDSVNLVYVPLINHLHFAGAKLALEAGKHVLLEKPFTLTADEAEALFVSADRKKCFLMEAQKAVFLPVIQEVKRRLEAGQIGQVEYVEILESRPGSETIPWFLDLAKGGGTLISNASYALSVLQFLFGNGFDQVKSLHTAHAAGLADDECQLIFCKNQLLMNLFISSKMKFQSRMIIHGSLGSITIADYWKTDTALIEFNDGSRQQIHIPQNSEFVHEIRHVAECIENGQPQSPIVSSDMTLNTVKIVEDCYKDWYGQQWPHI